MLAGHAARGRAVQARSRANVGVELARTEHQWPTVATPIMRISILVPTRNRPDNVERLLESAYRTADLPPEVWFYVDDDDPRRNESTIIMNRYGARWVCGERVVLSQMWNELATRAENDVMMHCGDDIVFRTQSWDTRVVEAFERVPDHLVLVHGDDGYQRSNIATHGFYHRNWIEVLGRFVPPYFSSDYNDLWLTEVADAVGRRVYLPDVYTEHMHPAAGKGELDQTHRERLERHERDGVAALYDRLAPERRRDVEALRDAIASGRYR